MNTQTKLSDLCGTSIKLSSSSVKSMTSLEIAELTGKRHDNITRDIRNMLIELDLKPLKFEELSKMPSGQNTNIFKLPKDLTLTLVSGYNIKMRHAIISRWEELERTVESGNFRGQIQVDHKTHSLSLKIITEENQKIKSDINELSRESSTYKRERNQAIIDRDYLNDLKKSTDWDIKELKSQIKDLDEANRRIIETNVNAHEANRRLRKEVESLKSSLSVISESIVNTVRTISQEYIK